MITAEQRATLNSLGKQMEISCARYSKLYDDYNEHQKRGATVEAYDAAYAVLKKQKQQFSQLCIQWGLSYWTEIEKFKVPY
ncbi:MAG: hypothetical protein LBU31_01130 [Coriobacteriales bacterium]|nr:hypothetical protein [Coriobacteriales bacterium]